MAGDIREIDMAKATNLDGKKVRLVGDDGKGYWMEKDTFISVVGELIGQAGFSTNGLMTSDCYKKSYVQQWYTSGYPMFKVFGTLKDTIILRITLNYKNVYFVLFNTDSSVAIKRVTGSDDISFFYNSSKGELYIDSSVPVFAECVFCSKYDTSYIELMTISKKPTSTDGNKITIS